ncbi:MAG: lysine--tRNA ligase [Planctomycetes bacterium]|nr:lysine--tRNA ligase [Planctomycetota bacterium]
MTSPATPNSPNTSNSPKSAPDAPAPKLEAQRRENRGLVAALGLNPYGSRVEGLIPLAEAKAFYSGQADEAHKALGKDGPKDSDPRPRVRIAGRIVLLRDNGKLIWANLRDETGDLQVAISQKDVSEGDFKFAKLSDLGDIIVVDGRLMKTKTGEITVWADKLTPGAKSLVPPPEKHAGLSDVELRYRQRYVDLWANPEGLRVFRLRSKIVTRVRQTLASRGFGEVETPMMQTLAGGAAARPFVTHMNALSINLFLRIAPELYLKRLLVGGMSKVYEINRNFRNEGLDKQHNPEFTMLEAYEAFGDCSTVMDLTESIIRDAARYIARQPEYAELNPTADVVNLRLPFGDMMIDYGKPFDRVRYQDLFEKALGFSIGDIDRCRKEAKERKIMSPDNAAKLDEALLINELFEEFAEKSISAERPTFITDYPAAISPLTRPSPTNPKFAERADLFIGHMEIAPHYTELNDPDVQLAKFTEQLGGLDADKAAEENTYRTLDEDFINALKVGMPPAGGMGLGIDRLVMLLTNQRTIRDVVLFPLMRPEA